ncbi:unnamed protein product [Blepharisma stoltei]|uniref:Uncharacterized protein n=1 Tax=Blepharisma stoltei TaxID=1481888 RepID=A0AAU9K5G9_9CILI|nr:unnamed protein product [Blepharisma stoltei]
MGEENANPFKVMRKTMTTFSRKTKQIENNLGRNEENDHEKRYNFLEVIRKNQNRWDDDFNSHQRRKAFSQDSKLKEYPCVTDIRDSKSFFQTNNRRNSNFGSMRPSTSFLNKRKQIDISKYKERISSYAKDMHLIFREESRMQNIRYFPKRSEFLKLRKAKEKISKKKAKLRLLANNTNQIELDLSIASPVCSTIGPCTILTSPISTPVTPIVYECQMKNNNSLKRRSVSSWSKRKENPIKINLLLEDEKFSLTPW